MSAQTRVSEALGPICSSTYQMSLLGAPTPRSSPHRLFHSETLLPLTFPISQHSWAVPHQSKGQFMGLMRQRAQTGLGGRMFGRYLAPLKQTSHQNMIREGRRIPARCIQAMLMSAKYHCFTRFHMFERHRPNGNKVSEGSAAADLSFFWDTVPVWMLRTCSLMSTIQAHTHMWSKTNTEWSNCRCLPFISGVSQAPGLHLPFPAAAARLQISLWCLKCEQLLCWPEVIWLN